MAKRSTAQKDRQHSRERGTGRYKKYNPCELCGKSVGYNYYSLAGFDQEPFGGLGQVLCKSCCEKLEALGKEAAYRVLSA